MTTRGRSLLGTVLVAAGALLVLDAVGFAARASLWRLWPIAPLFIGGQALLQRRRGQPSRIAPAASTLALLFIALGLLTGVDHGREQPHPQPGANQPTLDSPAPELTHRRTLEADLAAGDTLELDVAGAELVMTSTRSDGLRAVLRSDRTDDSRLELLPHSSGARLRFAPGDDHVAARIELQTPSSTRLRGRVEDGAIEITSVGDVDLVLRAASASLERVNGTVRIDAENGRVRLTDASSHVTARCRNASLDLRHLAAGATVDLAYGDLSISDVAGLVDLRTRSGSIDLREARGGVVVEAPRSAVRLYRIRGDTRVRLRHGSLAGHQLQGSADIHAAGSSISLKDLGGHLTLAASGRHGRIERAMAGISLDAEDVSLRILDSRGPFDLKLRRGDLRLGRNTGPVTVHLTDGSLVLPASSGSATELSGERAIFDIVFGSRLPPLDLAATPGRIVTPGGGRWKVTRQGADARLARPGPGPVLRAELHHGRIRLRQE